VRPERDLVQARRRGQSLSCECQPSVLARHGPVTRAGVRAKSGGVAVPKRRGGCSGQSHATARRQRRSSRTQGAPTPVSNAFSENVASMLGSIVRERFMKIPPRAFISCISIVSASRDAHLRRAGHCSGAHQRHVQPGSTVPRHSWFVMVPRCEQVTARNSSWRCVAAFHPSCTVSTSGCNVGVHVVGVQLLVFGFT
jgi:hypothetical protein